jgi:hypothetical protein
MREMARDDPNEVMLFQLAILRSLGLRKMDQSVPNADASRRTEKSDIATPAAPYLNT